MKSKFLSHSAIIASATAVTIAVSYSQTVEIDPGTPIPGTHNSIFATEWNMDGNTESWAANTHFTLVSGTPTGGLLTGTQGETSTDPNLSRSGLSLLTSPDTIIEFNITKNIADTSRIDLFWGDDAGGINAVRSITINQPFFPTDGLPHTVRITFSGQLLGKFTAFRIDPSADVVGQNKSTSLDYFRVYTSNPVVPTLTWDPAMTAGVTPGGAGTWNTSSNLWWNGTSQVAWPASPAGGNEAILSGTAGAVTLPAPITARYLRFTTSPYTLTGTGPLTVSGPAVLRNSVGTNVTTIDVPLSGSAKNTIAGGSFVFTKAATFTGPSNVTAALAFSVDNPLGASSNNLALGTGGNFTFGALGASGSRTIGNNISMTTNRIIINNIDYGTGLTALPLNLTGNVQLNLSTPGDIYLRRDLAIGGVVSGTGSANGAIFFDGNFGTMTLSNPANTFVGNIRFNNASTLEVAANGSMGDPANQVLFTANSGTLKLLSGFNSARPVVISNSSANVNPGTATTNGRIDTNGFNSTWTGTLAGAAFVAPAVEQQITSFVKAGAGTLTLDSGGLTANNLRSGGLNVEGGTLKIASGLITSGSSASAFGVSGDAFLEVDGGTFSSGNYSVGLGGVGTFTLNSGTYNNSLEFIIGWTGDGIFNMNGGLANLNNLSLTNAEPHTSTINLNGGEVRLLFFNARANAVTPATATINFNGSTLSAKGDRSDFIETNTTTVITANVQVGGAIINTNNFDLTINQPLIHDAALEATLDGGLTKLGTGTLLLAAANTYTGNTNVNEGCLSLSDITAIPDVTKVNVADGAGFGGIVGASNLLDADIQNIVDNTNWAVSGSFLVIDTNGADVTVAANITGNIGLIKKGDGVLTLTGANTYTGTTVVEGGSIAGAGGIADVAIAKTGATEVTLTFTASGLVDVYRSNDLQTWGAAYATDETSPYVDAAATGPKQFYVLVPAGQTYPPAP